MLDAAMLARHPAGLALGVAGNHLGEVAHAGKLVQGPVGAGLSLNLREVADGNRRLHMVAEFLPGQIPDAQVVGDVGEGCAAPVVCVDFSPEVLERLTIGDKIQIKACGCGLNLPDF
ncbi:MAG: DUF4438 domain-containing protein, partial [Proteobacteria bacterium]|nr:DUF4438 domain-containing protein [Pseudomonadota bacterium]